MSNQHGDFIWYELMTRDPEGAKTFYENILGWQLTDPRPDDDKGYREFSFNDVFIAGVLPLTDDMCEHGAKPMWLGYIVVDDVEKSIDKVRQLGGNILLPVQDIPGVGRFDMVADPVGVPFYIMRGSVEGMHSTSFKENAISHCAWNELATTDQTGALTFYGELFGWESKGAMPMGELGEYKFIDNGDARIGAISPHLGDSETPVWTYYFRVDDIDIAIKKIAAGGGKVCSGPHEVPSNDYIVIGSDPDGAMFALVGSKINATVG